MCVADADIVGEGIGGQHLADGEKEEGGVDEADDDCDLKEIEKYLELHACAAMGLRKEEHHQDGGAIEAIEQTACRFGQQGLGEQGVVGLDRSGNEQDRHDNDEEKPEQGSIPLSAPESDPGAIDGEKTGKDNDGFGKAGSRAAGAEQEVAQRLGSDEEGEEKGNEPGLAEVCESAQAGAATQVEIDCGGHQLERGTSAFNR